MSKPEKVVSPESESLQRIAEAYREVDEAEIAEALVKESYAEAKSRTKHAKANLRQVLHDDLTPLPLFDKPELAATDHPEIPEPAATDHPEIPRPFGGPTDDETWKAVPLKPLGLSEPILDNLEDAGLFTIGHVADWIAKKPLTDIGGIGPAKAKAIADALARYWEARSKAPRPAADEPPPEFDPPTD